jgi:hypothetical protein
MAPHEAMEHVLSAWNGEGDVAPWLTAGYRGHMLHDPARGERDAEEYPERIEEFRSRYPGVRFFADRVFEGEEHRATLTHAEWTDPETGELLVADGINVSRFQDGKLAEEWAIWSAFQPPAH